MKNKILLVGGGTGGHFVPLFAIYQKIKEIDPKIPVVIVGGGGPLEEKYFTGNSDYHILRTGKLHRNFSLDNLWQLVLGIYGLLRALILLLKEKPKIIFSKGGFVALPVLCWARLLKIPFYIHESDVEMGAANRWFVKDAQKVFTGFPIDYYKIPGAKLVFSGQLSDKVGQKNHTKYDFGFGDNKPIILVTGGSQGSHNLNLTVFSNLEKIVADFCLIHQTGANDFTEAIERRAKLPEAERSRYFATDFLGNQNGVNLMAEAIAASNIVISRASATAVSEIAAQKKPMILVPYKHAAANHQLKNAQILKKADACEIILDDDLSAEKLLLEIKGLLAKPEKMAKMAESAKDFFPSNGVSIVVNELLKEVK